MELLTQASLLTGFIILALGAAYFCKDAIAARGKNWEELHIVHFTIAMVAALAYLGMLMGQGTVGAAGRTVYWARYLDWFVTTPLILFSLARLASVRGSIIGGSLISNQLMIATGLFATLSAPAAKYVWYAISCIFEVGVLAILFGPVGYAARQQHPNVGNLYRQLLFFFTAYYVAYPIVWILSDKVLGLFGTPVETLLIAILDVIAKVVYALVLLKDKRVFERRNRSEREYEPIGAAR